MEPDARVFVAAPLGPLRDPRKAEASRVASSASGVWGLSGPRACEEGKAQAVALSARGVTLRRTLTLALMAATQRGHMNAGSHGQTVTNVMQC